MTTVLLINNKILNQVQDDDCFTLLINNKILNQVQDDDCFTLLINHKLLNQVQDDDSLLLTLLCHCTNKKGRDKPSPNKYWVKYYLYLAITNVAFVPPKPKLLDIAKLISVSSFSVMMFKP